jgi:hypothetical protein
VAHRRGKGLIASIRSPVDGVDTKLLLHALMTASGAFPGCGAAKLIPAVLAAPAEDFDIVRSRHWRPFVSESMIELARDEWREHLVTTRAHHRDGFVVVNTTSRHREVVDEVWPAHLVRQGWVRAWPSGLEPAVFAKSPVDGIEPEDIVEAARAAANRRVPFRAALVELLEALTSTTGPDEAGELLARYRVLGALRS